MPAEKHDEYTTRAALWAEGDHLELLKGWARDGYTYEDIADKIGVCIATLNNWRKKYPEIDAALQSGREVIDYKVENALLKAALGYKAKDVKVVIETNRKNGDVVSTTRETVERDIPPNVTACQVWLYNRLPEKWKRNRDKVLDLTDEDASIQVTVKRAGKDDGDDQMNESIEIKPAKRSSPKPKKEEDLDYWPDDWEDDDE